MIKLIHIKKKTIPVPIPLRTVDDVLVWVEKTLLKENEVITKVLLNGNDLLEDSKNFSRIILNEHSQVELEVDDPKELAIQSLESMIGFSKGISTDIQLIAVQCWQLDRQSRYEKFDKLLSDLFLVKELSDHMIDLVNLNAADSAPVQGITRLIFRVSHSLRAARMKSDWKECANILLNRLEYLLKAMASECENLQFFIVTSDQIKAKNIEEAY